MEMREEELRKWRETFSKKNYYEITDGYIQKLKNTKSENLAEELFNLAQNLEVGKKGFHKSLSKAYIWYVISAYCGCVEAQIRIGDLFADDKEYSFCNDIEDFEYYHLVFHLLTEIDALPREISYSTSILENDAVEACDWYRMAAEQGNPGAQYLMYCTLPSENEEWLHISSKSGHKDASFTLYLNNLNKIEGLKYLARSAKQGHEEALELLSRPVQLNNKEKNLPYNILAKQLKRIIIDGFEFDAILIGDDFFYGRNFEKDYEEAIQWYTIAAERGNRKAMVKLSDCYLCGFGVEADEEEAVKWHRRAEGFICEEDTLYVHKGIIKCIRDKHDIEQVTAIVYTNNGHEIRLSVNHCLQCNKLFISDSVYEHYRNKYGLFLCRISFMSDGHNTSNKLNAESLLHLMGYSVDQKRNLSDAERQEIIMHCINSKSLTKNEIVRLLTHLIDFNGQKQENWIAVEKWERDLYFTLQYNMEKQPKFKVKQIERYNRKHF